MASNIGTIGGKTNFTQGAQVDQSFEPYGAQRIADARGHYTDLVARGKVFFAANQAGAAVTNLNATATGFILTNPVNSGIWAAILRVQFIQTSTATTTANAGIQLAAGLFSNTAVTHTTPLTVRTALIGGSGTATLLADSSSTLPAAPVAVMNLWQPSVSATATTGIPPVVDINLDGLIILQPGCTLSMSALSTLSGATSMWWEEFAAPTNYA